MVGSGTRLSIVTFRNMIKPVLSAILEKQLLNMIKLVLSAMLEKQLLNMIKLVLSAMLE